MKTILCILLFASVHFIGITSAAAQPSVKTPEQVAQSLVDAYNARNMDGILKAYAADSVAYELPSGKVILKGHDEIRKKFASILQPNVNVKVEIVDRIVDGKFVIDKEKISGTSDGKKVEFFGTVIYEITDGLIRKEWYLEQ
jgi:Uncharacterized conserved protein